MTIAHPDRTDRLIEIPDGTAVADFIQGLADLIAFYSIHPDAPLPTGHLNVPVPDAAPGVRVEMLAEIAEALGLREHGKDDMGTLLADRWFGPIRLESHVSTVGQGARAWLDRAAARRGLQPLEGGNGGAA